MINNLSSYLNRSSSRSVGILFAINSFMFGNWVARIPEIKGKLHLSEGDLGLALLGVSVGAVLFMPLAAAIIKRLGAGKVFGIFIVLYCIAMVLPVMASSFLWLVIALFVVGATNGITDIAGNAAAAAIEKNERVNVMATTHGMWSLGGMIGAGLAGIVATLGINQPIHMMVFSVIMILLSISQFRMLSSVKDKPASTKRGFIMPNGPIIMLALIAFCILLSEGSIADWSAVFISKATNGNALEAALGYTGFSLTMTLGRFYGDGIIPRFGAKRILTLSTLIAVIGISLPTVITYPWIAILGFTICGFGYSLMVPIFMSAAANIKGFDPGVSIAMVSTLGYAGFLVGPPAIGFISETINLKVGLLLVALLTSFVFIYSLTRTRYDYSD